MALVVAFLLFLLAVFTVRRLWRHTTFSRFSPTQQSLMAIGLLLVPILLFTGRLGILVPLIGAVLAAVFATLSRSLPVLIPLLIQYLPVWQRYRQQKNNADHDPSQSMDSSTVTSRFLRMELRHSTGELSGEILEGAHRGENLKNLSLTELVALHRTYAQEDVESARLLVAYMERLYGDRWQESASSHQQETSQASISRSEAMEILGLPPEATRDEIIAAHRRLIQKLHPDRGGSGYLAAKINHAKDVLLGI